MIVFARAIVFDGEVSSVGQPIEEFRLRHPSITDGWVADAVACGHLVVVVAAPDKSERPAPPFSTRTQGRRGRSDG